MILVLLLRGVIYASNLRRASWIANLALLDGQTLKTSSEVLELSGCYLSEVFLFKFFKRSYKTHLDLWILQTSLTVACRIFISGPFCDSEVFVMIFIFLSLFLMPRSSRLKSLVGLHTCYEVLKFIELASFFSAVGHI